LVVSPSTGSKGTSVIAFTHLSLGATSAHTNVGLEWAGGRMEDTKRFQNQAVGW
jgi:hypothetical protein